MSRETLTHLNTQTLIGFTDKRGNAWHYRAEEQGDEPNHYPGAIPVADVKRRLFDWTVGEGSVETNVLTDDGVLHVVDPTRKTVVRLDTGAILGVHGLGYRVHDYTQWLIENVETLLNDHIEIGSAGLLRGGALAWVQVEAPETLSTPEGVDYRPFISAATSLDGTLKSIYTAGSQLVVCDNTLSASLRAADALHVKVSHTSNSLGRLNTVRAALGLEQVAENFAAQVAEQCATRVSDAQWAAFLDAHTPLVDGDGEPLSARSLTLATRKRETLDGLWNHDDRVSPWKGTLFGGVQAVNTFTHHEGIVRGADRAQRNALRVVTGGVDKLDAATLRTFATVLA